MTFSDFNGEGFYEYSKGKGTVIMSGTISTAFNCCYGDRFNKVTYLPMFKQMGEKLGTCYGIGFPRGYAFTDEPMDHMALTKIPTRLNRFVFSNYCKLAGKPSYYAYQWQGQLIDKMIASKLKKDDCDILFTRANMTKCIDMAKSLDKKIVVLASSSEPMRQYRRYKEEVEYYKIDSNSIYGNKEFAEIADYGYKQADRIITISNVSNKTFISGGYSQEILNTIPLTGTSFNVHEEAVKGKQKAFISTAMHSMLKGTHRLLLAWKKAGIKDIPLIIAGGLHDDMKEFIKKYGPFENVIFTGFCNDLEKYYEAYDAVGILMSFSEGAVRTTPELMSFGFPMIVSPDATCDIVEDGKTGFIIEPTDIDALADRLKWFAEDWNRVYDFRENVFEAVKHRKSSDFGIELAEYLVRV